MDGRKGLPEALTSVFPQTPVQLCLVHLVRYSLQFVGYKERKAVATDLKTIYHAPTAQAAEQARDDFAAQGETKYPLIVKSWRSNSRAYHADVWLPGRVAQNHLYDQCQ